MPEIPYETGAYYVFDRGYNNFGELYRIQRMESFFVVRAKTNLQYRCVRWQIELFFNMQLKRSTYEVLQILSISLTDKTPLRELFDKTYSNDVKSN